MERLEPFWAGAQEHGHGVDWTTLERIVGGRARVPEADVAALVTAGVRLDRAQAWLAARATETCGQVVTWVDLRYPEALRRTHRPPPVLMVEGDIGALQGPATAIVGTRAASRYGLTVARQLGAELARAGHVVVSGLARGVDAEAHEGAVGQGRTVAVLGHGLGFTAPQSHTRLRARIVEAGGAMVSVWPDDHPPRPHTFPRRNVWIAGLSDAVVVVEAGERSGALITADAAAREGRDVFAVPGPIDRESSLGCNRLIDQGAGVVTDVASFVARRAGVPVARREGWEAWVEAGTPVDEVARRLGRPVTEVIGWLTRGELEGTWVRVGGQRWARR